MTGLSVSVQKTFGAFSLDASWSIGNELAVLFGCSGAGKSITLRMIAGLIAPDAGMIGLNGRTLYSSAAAIDLAPQARSFGYVFQDLALFPHMTVRQNILYGAHGVHRDEREARAEGMIERFQLAGLEHKLPACISGGQQQRVALARALIRRPDALLLDEPFSALDAPLRRELQDFLQDLRQEFPIPIVFVTHDVDEAAALADKIILYADGGVAQCGAPAELSCFARGIRHGFARPRGVTQRGRGRKTGRLPAPSEGTIIVAG